MSAFLPGSRSATLRCPQCGRLRLSLVRPCRGRWKNQISLLEMFTSVFCRADLDDLEFPLDVDSSSDVDGLPDAGHTDK